VPARIVLGRSPERSDGPTARKASATDAVRAGRWPARAGMVPERFRLTERQSGAWTLAHVARIVVYLTAREHLSIVLDVRRRYFREPYPASTAVVVVGLAHSDWLVEIEATAVLP
jgi:Endoribonuclease L-PSP